MSESGRNKHPGILNHLKSLLNPSLKGTCIHRPLFKCQEQLKLSSRSPLLMFQKREMRFWCWELLHFYFLSLKKICSFPKTVTGFRICHLMLVINLVGKLIYSYFSLFLIWDSSNPKNSPNHFSALEFAVPNPAWSRCTGGLWFRSLFWLGASAGICSFTRNQPAFLFPCQFSSFPVVSYLSGHLPSQFFKFGSYFPHQ